MADLNRIKKIIDLKFWTDIKYVCWINKNEFPNQTYFFKEIKLKKWKIIHFRSFYRFIIMY